MKETNNFQIVEIQSQGVAELMLNFLPIPAWRCLLILRGEKVIENPVIFQTLLTFCGS